MNFNIYIKLSFLWQHSNDEAFTHTKKISNEEAVVSLPIMYCVSLVHWIVTFGLHYKIHILCYSMFGIILKQKSMWRKFNAKG